MGPILIFDKSLLQSLNEDEAMWLDNFFNTNITPLFFIETLADLEKEVKSGRTPEQIVGSLAIKTPDMSGRPNEHHLTLIAGELRGVGTIGMDGRPIITGGRTVETDGRVGIMFEQSPEEEAFNRWQNGEFLEIERLYAKAWRQGLSDINLEDKYLLFQKYFVSGRPKTLEEVKEITNTIIEDPDQESALVFGMWLIGVSPDSQQRILERWKALNKPPLRKFAPYFTHVLSVDLFFYLGIAADLIGRGRPSHKIDVAYLYYLPFCKVFTSNDKLHAQIIPYFLSEKQVFIPGAELKADLKMLDEHYNALPDEVKARGVSSFAMFPPQDGSFLICKLWDRYMASDWRKRDMTPPGRPKTEASEGIFKQIRQMQEAAKSSSPVAPIDSDKADNILIKRMVRGHKGKWTRFPPEIMNRRKNEKGEWEDIPKPQESPPPAR
jgi:hypothetical protein